MLASKKPLLFCLLFGTTFHVALAIPNLRNKKIDSAFGRQLAELITGSLKAKDTTSARKETKALISKTLLADLFTNLEANTKKKPRFAFWRKAKSNAIVFKSRDKAAENAKNSTFTFYGKGFHFMNLGVKTKIKLRARTYLQVFPNHVERSKSTQDSFFLELKVKNPNPEKPGSVEKLRVKIRDQDLLHLYRLDATADSFKSELSEIKSNVLSFNPDDGFAIENMFYVIYQLAKIKDSFIKPVYAISYIRSAREFTEDDYKRKTFWGRKSYKEIQYQFTVDEFIKGYMPNIPMQGPFDFTPYLCTGKAKDLVYHFPDDAVSVEFKIPQLVAEFTTKEQSTFHHKFTDVVLKVLTDPANKMPGFEEDRGKIGHFRKQLKANPKYAPFFVKEKKQKKKSKQAVNSRAA